MADLEIPLSQIPIQNDAIHMNGNGYVHQGSTDEDSSTKEGDTPPLNGSTEQSPPSQLKSSPVDHHHHHHHHHHSDDEEEEDGDQESEKAQSQIEVQSSPLPSPSKESTSGSFTGNESGVDLQRQIQDVVREILEKSALAGVRPMKAPTASEQLAKLLSSQQRSSSLDMETEADATLSSVSTQQKRNGTILRSLSEDSGIGRRYNPPAIPINDLRQEDWHHVSEGEKTLRCHLAALHRLVDIHGWSQGIYNHISANLSTTSKQFLVNPIGFLCHEISASNLLKVDIHGQPIRDTTPGQVNKGNWKVHADIYSARADVKCIAHLHLPDVIVVSCMKIGLLPVSAEGEELLMRCPQVQIQYHAYRGEANHAKDPSQLLRDLGSEGRILFLRNHGALVCGSSVEETWHLMRLLVHACQAQTRLVQVGGIALVRDAASPYRPPPSAAAPSNGTASKSSAQLEFEAMMRLLDNAGYRTGYAYQQPILMERILQALTNAVMESLETAEEESVVSLAGVIHSPLLAQRGAAAAFDERKAQENAEKIKQQCATNRQAALQRNQWLTQSLGRPSANDAARKHATIAEEPEAEGKKSGKHHHEKTVTHTITHTTTTTVNKYATLPASQHAVESDVSPTRGKLPATAESDVEVKNGRRSSDHLVVSDSEHHRHKKGPFASFRMPSFSKKKK